MHMLIKKREPERWKKKVTERKREKAREWEKKREDREKGIDNENRRKPKSVYDRKWRKKRRENKISDSNVRLQAATNHTGVLFFLSTFSFSAHTSVAVLFIIHFPFFSHFFPIFLQFHLFLLQIYFTIFDCLIFSVPMQ